MSELPALEVSEGLLKGNTAWTTNGDYPSGCIYPPSFTRRHPGRGHLAWRRLEGLRGALACSLLSRAGRGWMTSGLQENRSHAGRSSGCLTKRRVRQSEECKVQRDFNVRPEVRRARVHIRAPPYAALYIIPPKHLFSLPNSLNQIFALFSSHTPRIH